MGPFVEVGKEFSEYCAAIRFIPEATIRRREPVAIIRTITKACPVSTVSDLVTSRELSHARWSF
jgi:hypothetical protein